MGYIWDFKKYGQANAFADDNYITVSYDALSKEEQTICEFVEPRSLVCILCTNTIGSAMGYVSFVNNGVVPMMLSAGLEKALLNSLIDVYSPRYFWIPSEKIQDFEGDIVYECYGYSLIVSKKSDFCVLNDQLALLLTTSGSTGSPKFVRQSYKNISANTKSIIEYLELTDSERPITTLPMNYTYGLSIINTHLAVGATILFTEKGLMQKEFWSFFRDKCATSFGGVPYTYEMLDKLRFYRMDLPSLKTLTQAGGKLSPELHSKFADYAEKTNRKFVVMYGQCEATARMSYLPPDKAVEKKGSMGIAIPGGKFKLIDENNCEITKPYTAGELVYEGSNVTLGYAENRDDLGKGDERGGVLFTGDMAQFDEDGFYYIVGRKKRFLKIYGNRVNLDEMDSLIKTRYGIDVACTGKDDHMYLFVTDEDYKDKIRKYAVEKTGLNPTAFTVMVIDSIPRNESGKILYNSLSVYFE